MKSFKSLNDKIAEQSYKHYASDLQTIEKLTSQFLSQATLLPSNYADQYNKVQLLQYNDQSQVEDVTDSDRQTVPESTISDCAMRLNAIRDQIKLITQKYMTDMSQHFYSYMDTSYNPDGENVTDISVDLGSLFRLGAKKCVLTLAKPSTSSDTFGLGCPLGVLPWRDAAGFGDAAIAIKYAGVWVIQLAIKRTGQKFYLFEKSVSDIDQIKYGQTIRIPYKHEVTYSGATQASFMETLLRFDLDLAIAGACYYQNQPTTIGNLRNYTLLQSDLCSVPVAFNNFFSSFMIGSTVHQVDSSIHVEEMLPDLDGIIEVVSNLL